MEIVQESRVEESTTYGLAFQIAGASPGAGFMFDCDADGVVIPSEHAMARENLAKCQDGTFAGTWEGIVVFEHRYRHPRIGRCSCGSEVELGRFTNTCECGADYNSAGQLLADRSQWGEETGELPHECV